MNSQAILVAITILMTVSISHAGGKISGCGVVTLGYAKGAKNENLGSKRLQPRQLLMTPDGHKLEVVKYGGEGVRGIAYKVKNSKDSNFWALKLAKDGEPQTMKSFAQEEGKIEGRKAAGLKQPDVFELGRDYNLKMWVDGTSGEEYFEGWVDRGMPKGEKQIKALSKMIHEAAERGVYVGDLNPSNLLWTKNEEWVVIDSGTHRTDLSKKEILERYIEHNVGRRWTDDYSEDVQIRFKAELRDAGKKASSSETHERAEYKLEVLSTVTDGHKALVYKVRDQNGNIYAEKVPKDDSKKAAESIRKEPIKTEELKKLNVRYARLFAHGDGFILKEWVEGTRGDKWVKDWVANGSKKSDPVYKNLMALFDSLIEQGVYVGNLKDLNLIYDGTEWVIVDFGSIEGGISKKELKEKYKDVFENRWL